jgi:hypothetical protein
MGEGKMEHTFSVEMKSRKHVKHISMSNESHDRVLFEGILGELEELSMVEGAVLEVRGVNGVLRIDLSEEELRKMLFQKKG